MYKRQFLIVGEIPDAKMVLIQNYFNKATLGSKLNINITKNIIDAIKSPNLVIITSLGITKRDDLLDISSKLIVQKINVLGLLILNNYNIK